MQANRALASFEDEAFGIRFLIRDRNTKFTRIFDDVFASIGARVIKTRVRAPHGQRVCGTIREDRPHGGDYFEVQD